MNFKGNTKTGHTATGTQFFITTSWLVPHPIDVFFFIKIIINNLYGKENFFSLYEKCGRYKWWVRRKDIVAALKRHFRIKDDDITNEYY